MQQTPCQSYGDADFQAAIARHARTLHETARRLTGSRDDADDLVQDAVLRAWTFWHRFEPGSNARAWLHRILVNTFINGYRKKRRERELLRAAGEEARRVAHLESTVRGQVREGLGDEVGSALALLPPEFRSVVELVDIQDCSYREVAEALGCPIGTVMSRLHRARRQLKRLLGDYAVAEGYVREQAVTAAAA